MKTVYNVWYGTEVVGNDGVVKYGVEDLVATFYSETKVTRYMRECIYTMRGNELWKDMFIKDIPDGVIPEDTKIICAISHDRTERNYMRFASYNVR